MPIKRMAKMIITRMTRTFPFSSSFEKKDRVQAKQKLKITVKQKKKITIRIVTLVYQFFFKPSE